MVLSRTNRQIESGWDTESFAAFLKGAFAQAGLTANPLTEFDTDGHHHLVWLKTVDATKPYGKFYFCVAFDSSSIRQAVFADYDAETQSLPESIAWSEWRDLQPSRDYTAICLQSVEAGLIILSAQYSSEDMLLGWVRPAAKASFWDENTAPFAFCHSLSGNEWLTTEKNYFTYQSEMGTDLGRFRSNFPDPFPSSKNPITGETDVLTGIFLYAHTPEGQAIVGVLSGDWGRAGDRTLIPGVVVAIPNGQQFVVISRSPEYESGAGVARVF